MKQRNIVDAAVTAIKEDVTFYHLFLKGGRYRFKSYVMLYIFDLYLFREKGLNGTAIDIFYKDGKYRVK